MKRKLPLVILVFIFTNTLLFETAKADIKFSGDATGASAYVWRGIKQFDGVALQGTATVSYKALSFGVWYSTVNFKPVATPFMETDPFIELHLPTSPFSTSLGSTIYCYDFKTFNDEANYEYELFVRVELGTMRSAFYWVPEQNSTRTDLNHSYYWADISTSLSGLGVDWGLVYEFGTYSSRFLSSPGSQPVGDIVLSVSKPIHRTMTITWSYSIPTSPELTNNLIVMLSTSF